MLLRLLHEHGTLTGPQIRTLLFPSAASTRVRLGKLYRNGWIANFHTQRGGHPLPVHWVLTEWGSRWAASNAGTDQLAPRQVRLRNERLAGSAQLAHTDGTNDFFVALIAASRNINRRTAQDKPTIVTSGTGNSADVTRLARWWSAAHTARAMDGRLRPDGHGVWEAASSGAPGDLRQVPFYLEFDRGTEPLPRLSAKLPVYLEACADGFGPDWPVLIVVPTRLRERHLHEHMRKDAAEQRAADPSWPGAHPYQSPETVAAYRQALSHPERDLTVLTTNLQDMQAHPLGPAGPVWHRLTGSPPPNESASADEEPPGNGFHSPRITLLQIAAPVPYRPASRAIFDPGPPRADEDPLQGFDPTAPKPG